MIEHPAFRRGIPCRKVLQDRPIIVQFLQKVLVSNRSADKRQENPDLDFCYRQGGFKQNCREMSHKISRSRTLDALCFLFNTTPKVKIFISNSTHCNKLKCFLKVCRMPTVHLGSNISFEQVSFCQGTMFCCDSRI